MYLPIAKWAFREWTQRPTWRDFASVWRAIGFVASMRQRPCPIRVRTADLGPLDRGRVLLTWRELARPDTHAARLKRCEWCATTTGACDCWERILCTKQGVTGHSCCGWCPTHGAPLFNCMCPPAKRRKHGDHLLGDG